MKPRKILHIASRSDYRFGDRFYSFPYKINNGFVRNGHNVIWFSDRDVAKSSSLIPARSLGRKICNKKFVEFCKNFKPEIIAMCSPNMISLDTLLFVKEILPECIIFQYNLDGLYLEANVKKIMEKVPAMNWTFCTTTAGPALNAIATNHAPASFLPNSVDPSIDTFKNHERDTFVNDLLFIGGSAHWNDPENIRVIATNNVLSDLSDVNILKSDHLWGDDFVQAYGNSKMALSFNHRPPGVASGPDSPLYLGASDRISYCLGNGLLTFTDSLAELTKLYGPESLIEVSGYEDLLEKIKRFSKDDVERKRIAENGYNVAHEKFNCTLVTKYMVDKVLGDDVSTYAWPTDSYYGY